MGVEIIKGAYKIKMGRHRTQVTTYENLTLQTTHPIKEDKQKKIKPTIPSDYAGYNYFMRQKKRRRVFKEMAYNSFDEKRSVMLTLTFSPEQGEYTEISKAHREFKKFIQRINSHYNDFRYIATYSRQSNGNWHYHVLCNFDTNIKNSEISAIWKRGKTYVTYIKDSGMFITVLEYLIKNMNESAEDLKGKHGYLCSKAIERDIEVVSWRAEQEKEFDEAFERVEANDRVILYETRNHLGIKGERVDEETGEIFEVTIPDRELDNTLRNAGYDSWDSVYTHLSSKADFSDKFSELRVATPKQCDKKVGSKEISMGKKGKIEKIKKV